MDHKYKQLRKRFKGMCRPALEDLCRNAGLSVEETRMIVMFYSEQKDIDSIADEFHMARNTVNNRKRILMDRIMDFEEFISVKIRANGQGGAYV